MSVRQLLNFVFSWALERIDPEKVEQWLVDLEAPLPYHEKRAGSSAASAEAEKAAFRAAMAAG